MTASVPDPAPGPDSGPTSLLIDGYPWARQWRGEWIGAGEVEIDGSPGPDSPRSGPFARHLYRSTIELGSMPATAPLRVSADSRYVLYVNGVEAGRGPVRSQPRRLHYDSYDVAPLLHAGPNRIVVLGTYYGMPNSFWQPAPGTGNFGKTGVVVLEMLLGTSWFVTGPAWEVQAATAWSTGTHAGFDGVPVERFDARLLEADWANGTGGAWEPAYVQPVVHLGGLGRTRPPTDPYGAMLARPIGALGGTTVRPSAAARCTGPVADGPDSPVEHVLGSWASAASALTAGEPGLVSCSADAAATHAVTFDFGRIVAGRVAFSLVAPAGTVVDILYREEPAREDELASFSTPRIGARYIARGYDDDFLAQEHNALRHANLLVTVPGPASVRIRDFRVRESVYQQAGSASFRSSDPELDALYRAGIRTVELNSYDAYTDCPTREQRSWVGDGVVHQTVSLTTSADWRLPRWYIELANSPRSDGILPMSVVGEIEHSQGLTIPDWSLYWIHGVHTLYRYTGDRAAVAAAAPTARRVLEWFESFLSDEGVLTDVAEWSLVDWSSVFLDGASSILTAFWAAELREFAEFSDHLGNAGDATWARHLYERARSGYEVFWDESRGTYVDHVVDGEPKPAASQLAGGLAILSGLAPATRTERIVGWISDPGRQVTRSWVGGEGIYDSDRVLDQMRGIRRVDWDERDETVVAEPFASFLVHDAYAVAGRRDLVVAAIRRWTSFLQDGFDTFGECWGWGTHVHGWSSTPTRDIVQVVLGVTPAEPGFMAARIAPLYGAVERMEGSVPTPFGPITVSVRGDDAVVTSPVPFTLVRADGSEEAGAPHES